MISLRIWALTSSEMRLPGTSASPAPITISTVNGPRNKRASLNLRETLDSVPIASRRRGTAH
jgi:hypothetical protein